MGVMYHQVSLLFTKERAAVYNKAIEIDEGVKGKRQRPEKRRAQQHDLVWD